jgi:hypothetical protein
VAGCSISSPVRNDPTVNALATPKLRTFRDMAEFDEYRARVREIGKGRGVYWSQLQPRRGERVLLAQAEEEPCDPTVMDCGARNLQEIAVTAQRASPSRTSITNNQESDVDEGDIVKQYGRFLIVLQDGRLFSIDMGSRAAELKLADRIDVYSSAKAEAWYDELLIHDNHLVVTGYNYGEDATEINVISVDEAGKLALEARYYLQSQDYYSGSNYASRLVRGRFVIYTPVDISSDDPLEIPRIRSWTAQAGYSPWRPLFDITDVYLPVQQTLTPMLHVVSVCSLDRRESFGCDSRGVVGPAWRELYVSGKNVYLWLTSDYNEWAFGHRGVDECAKDASIDRSPPLPAAVFQLPFGVDAARAVHTIGAPPDQFAFDERDEELLVLVAREPQGCYYEGELPFIFSSIPLNLFAASPVTLGSRHSVRVRDAYSWGLQTRYTKDYLLYGSEEADKESTTGLREGEIAVVPVSNPTSSSVLRAAHSIKRLEVIGDNAVAFGQTDGPALGVSTVSLRLYPRIASTLALEDIVESEGRSHAFNAIIEDDGSGTFGLPTVYRSKARNWWSDIPSDVQFFALGSGLEIAPVGELAGQDMEEEDYECEVSCYDWYGNARPIFVAGRVFALTGSELIEGEIRAGAMVETGRLRMTAAPVNP